MAWQHLSAGGRGSTHAGGGIWVYAPDPALPPEQRAAASCALFPDKYARPSVLPLGSAVTGTLTMAGSCPEVRGPLQLAIVSDRSRSMGWDYTMARAQSAVWTALGALDPATT